jgi:hypothetical protein
MNVAIAILLAAGIFIGCGVCVAFVGSTFYLWMK